MATTTKQLVAQIRRKAGLPNTEGQTQPTRPHDVLTQPGDFTDEELLVIATEEMHTLVVPGLVAMREDFFRVRTMHPATREIQVLPEALGYRNSFIGMRRVGDQYIEPIPRFSASQVRGERFGFELFGDKLVLTFDPAPGHEIVIDYFRRPPALTTLDGKVIDKTTSAEITLNGLVINEGDFIWSTAAEQPFATGEPVEVTGVSQPQYTLSDLTAVNVGDIVTLVGYTSIVPLPEEACAVLSQAAANLVLQSLGDAQALGYGQQLLGQAMSAMKVMHSPRTDGNPRAVVRQNSRYRRGIPRNWRGWR